jgi:hypothetical protein
LSAQRQRDELPATVQLLPEPTNNIQRLVRITPSRPLLSEKTKVVVVDGERGRARRCHRARPE